ncbi:MAG: tRNA pseudouridine(38-40) synthase TruA [Muribaculaceae bacterium]|nr:tRNA pseudouridine(38-40) synthase TruA [Muribaculaceae bacterium]
MPRYFLKLAYNGTGYHGWQRQPNAKSVQETIEDALTTLYRKSVSITGAGRTDTGVNARIMYAHFDTESEIEDVHRMIRSLNSLLGNNIVIYDIIRVHNEAHARFDATLRTYKYFVLTHKSPFAYPYAWHAYPTLDFEAMNDAAKILLTTDDFTSFSKLHTDVKTNICNVTEAIWTPISESSDAWAFTISADRFLRNMVRAVVGTLVEVGAGKISISDFSAIISSKNRSNAGTSMPPHPLFLWDIKYSYL